MQIAMAVMAGLALLILAVWLRGLFDSQEHKDEIREAWGAGWQAILQEFARASDGVVTITYTSKFAGFGTSTPPTAIQASQLQVQTAQVAFADADAQAVVVHNWGSLPGAASFASFLSPAIGFYCALATNSPSSFATNFTFGISNTNSVTINKIGVGTGSGGTFNLIMRLL